ARAHALVVAAAVAVVLALESAAGAGADLGGAQALGQADLVGGTVVSPVDALKRGHVFEIRIAADRQELAGVDLDALGFLGAHAVAAILDDALALALGIARRVGDVAL